jgi:hypothetical protein
VEPDERMARVARGKGIAVEVSTFEEWDARGRTFDLLVSGQAWHWVRPDHGARKAAEVLRSGAQFAVFWNSLRHADDVFAIFRDVYGHLAPTLLVDSVALGTADPEASDDAAPFAATGEFVDIERRRYDWERSYTVAEWLDEVPTHSSHRVLEPQLLDSILTELRPRLEARGRDVVTTYRTSAVVGRRR